MFTTRKEETHEDQSKSSFKKKAKMFLYTIVLARIIHLALGLLRKNEDKE